ncbi:nucleoside hydrolase [Longispora sp. NPDC051575]|uniref:nucleoside hydrolase n=1 Tax=Longispora sp. NPDC051575 TaxID=3154943 RepID=UPI00341C7C37
MTTRLILDVDTGTDDAVAIMCAALHPGLELVGVGTVNGNVPLPNTTENTLRVLDHIGVDVPVHRGAALPLERDCFPDGVTRRKASDWHGEYLNLPPATSTVASDNAAEFLVETYMGPLGPDTVLVPTGPLTNVAQAIRLEPRIVDRIPRIVLMGGGHRRTNRTAAAESNLWMDPEAARVVLRSGVRDITVVPLDATHEALVTDVDCDKLDQVGTPAATAAVAFIRQRIHAHDTHAPLDLPHSAPVHDALCVAALIHPSVLEHVGHYPTDIETTGELTVGQLVVDTRVPARSPATAHVALGANRELFVAFLLEALAFPARSQR